MSTDEEEIAETPVVDKGKGRQNYDPSNNTPHDYLETAYPPINEDGEETRRVEENLRRWEVAERRRRKTARASHSHTVSVPSLVSDVSRRASLLFAGRSGRQHSVSSFANHNALRSQDSIDVVPLTQNLNNGFPPSPTPSEHDGDPFANSPRDTLSPFDDVHSARRTPPSSTSPRVRPEPPSADTAKPRTKQLPPPKPPPLRSPPPSELSMKDRSEKTPYVRWWHDWLCGCGEGSDRGGEFQAGHTNPLE